MAEENENESEEESGTLASSYEDSQARAGELADDEGSQSQIRQAYSGPLPPPSWLEHYAEIQSDFPERILSLTEREAAHRHEIQKNLADSSIKDTRRGQVFGLVVACVVLFVAALALILNHPWIAGILGGGTLVSLVGVFVYGRSSRSSDADD